ncbi:MAG: Ig-like domain repeat protein [Rhodanobacteraceae bacterium]|nr:Ig-like domain repeat protein [Rhodanobacteraceae bacterium]
MRALLVLALLAAEGHAATFTVTSAADTSGATCGATCTLRQALSAANASAGADTIAFNIPGAGPHRISIASTLPSASAVVIDGYSQPGASANSDPLASNAVLKIIVDARNLPAAISVGGLRRQYAARRVGGRPAEQCRDRSGQRKRTRLLVQCRTGRRYRGQQWDGCLLTAGQTASVGGSLPADRNVFAATGAAASAILAGAGGAHTVQGNLIGLRPDGQTPGAVGQAVVSSAISAGQLLIDNTIACTVNAVAMQSYGGVIQNNRLGTTVSGGDPGCTTGRLSTGSGQRYSGNTFGYFNSTPVSLASNLSGVVFRNNRIIDVDAVPFDLNGNGFTPNDADDSDTGANGLQNYAVVSDARILDADHLQLSGTLRSTANTSFALDFYASSEVSRAAFGFFALANAERVSTSGVTVTTDASGLASFGPVSVAFDGSGVMGVVSTTATRLDSNGNAVETSEYGEARATYSAGSGDFVVTNTNIGGPGSLLRALLEAEARPDGAGRDRITFNIPGGGPHTLSTGVLTTMQFAGKLELDGMTQPGSVANTSSSDINAQLKIDINGSKLDFNHADSLVRGVIMRGPSALLSLIGGGSVEGSFIGVSADGLSLATTPGNTTQINCLAGCRIGGPAPAQRNLIGCPQQNAMSCINVGAANARVEGNLIGVARDGLTRLVTPTDPGASQVFTAIELQAGNAQIVGNTIGGFTKGIRLLFNNHLIQNNRIGVGVDGLSSIANARNGIEISGSGVRVLGNHFANNVRDGVLVRNGSTLVTMVENTFSANGEQAIDLDVSNTTNGDGVSANDPLDADAGPNTGQNFPVLSQVRRDANGVTASVSLNSTPSQSFRLRYCYVATPDQSGNGECDQPIVGVLQTVSTDANGNFSGTTPVLPATTLTHLTATAALVAGIFEGTSEFAQSARIADVTTTTITADTPDPSTFGQAINVAVTVAGLSTTPTGTVNVASSNGGSCTINLSAGSGNCALTPSGAGAITLTADYVGNAEFAASSDGEMHTVSPASTTTTILSDTPDPSTFGDAITVSYRVQSTPAASGTVTVSDGVAQCQGSVGAGGNGSCVLTPAAGGGLTLTASYAGSSNFGASNDTEAHTVNAVASTLAILSDTPDPSVAGQPVNVAAQLTSGVGAPAGPIVISDGAGAACQISGANGNCNLIPINAGAITLRADFAGSGTHLPSTAASPHSVDRAATTLSPATPVGADGGAARQFAPMRFAVSVSVSAPGAGVPTGSITVTGTPGVEVCVITLPAASCDLIVQTPGTRTFDVAYAGDSRFLASTTQVSAQVLPDALFGSRFEEDE